MKIPEFSSREESEKWLNENRDQLQKEMEDKVEDGMGISVLGPVEMERAEKMLKLLTAAFSFVQLAGVMLFRPENEEAQKMSADSLREFMQEFARSFKSIEETKDELVAFAKQIGFNAHAIKIPVVVGGKGRFPSGAEFDPAKMN